MKKIYLLLLVLGIGLSSCQKFLDIKATNSQAPITKVNDLQLLLDQDAMNEGGSPSEMSASADEYYLDESAYNSDKITQEDRDFYTWKPGAVRAVAGSQWTPAYRVIYNANLALEYEEKFRKAGGQDPAALNAVKGQALFLRGHMHWWLTQQYGRPYGPNAASEMGIPLKKASDINEKVARSTVQQTYASILEDLNEAVNLLEPTSVVRTRPNKASAYAMLARVYLSMGDYTNAFNNADASLALNKTLMNYNGGTGINPASPAPFARYNSEVLFHNSTSGHALLEPVSTITVARISKELYDLYGSNDLRKTLFFKPNNISFSYPNPADPTKTLTVAVPDGTYRFSGAYNNTTGSGLFNGIAVDEVLLIRAECYARAGNAAKAIEDLNFLLVTRFLTGSYIALQPGTAVDALEKVLLERRKELVLRGLRWTDMRRLKLSASRDIVSITATGTSPTVYTVSRTVKGNLANLAADDPRYTLNIPTEVVNFGGIEQPPR